MSRLLPVLPALMCLFVSGSLSGGECAMDAPGLIGVGAGFSFHAGRTMVVDAVSGATSTTSIDEEFYEPAAALGAFLDMGLADSSIGPGASFGIRMGLDVSRPGPFYGVSVMPRYRLSIAQEGDTLKSVEPWIGFGFGFQSVHGLSSDVYLSLPGALGCDLQLLFSGFYIGAVIDVTLNPLGPHWSTTHGETRSSYTARHNMAAIKLVLTHRFY